MYVLHEVEILLKQYSAQTLSPEWTNRYKLILLMLDNVVLRRFNTLNPATLIPRPDDGEEHHQSEQVMHTSGKL